MIILKKKEAFSRALKAFGPWKNWSRGQHLAYGLIRGVPYNKMERCANDDPHAFITTRTLYELGAYPELPPVEITKFYTIQYSVLSVLYQELKKIIIWVKKEPRVKKIKLIQEEETT